MIKDQKLFNYKPCIAKKTLKTPFRITNHGFHSQIISYLAHKVLKLFRYI